MLRNANHAPANQVIANLVDELLSEERQQLTQERRSLHREPFARPISIVMREAADSRR